MASASEVRQSYDFPPGTAPQAVCMLASPLTASHRYKLVHCVLGALAVTSACTRATKVDETRILTPTVTFEIGGHLSAASSDEFVSIRDLLIARDGRLWVIDDQGGIGQDGPHRLLVYDSLGVFDREVGRSGGGPGEFRNPVGMVEFRDGRIAIRDQGFPGRVMLFDAGGEFLNEWTLPTGVSTVIGGRPALEVDTRGALWVHNTGRPSPGQRPSVYLVYAPGGTPLGVVEAPQVAANPYDLELSTRLVGGGVRRVGWHLPFRPIEQWAWGPHGAFARIHTSEYRVTFVSMQVSADSRASAALTALGDRSVPMPIARRMGAVQVTEREREARREMLRGEVALHPGGQEIHIPALPRTKPPLRGVSYTQDGRLLVMVATASSQLAGRWREPESYDIFDQDGRFEGRMTYPLDFRLVRFNGERACGIVTDVDEVETIRCYHLDPVVE